MSKRDLSLKVSIYGLSGTGKTTFASTFPKPALVVKFEEGTNSVYNIKGLDDVPVFKGEEIKELVESTEVLRYKTLIIDNATELQAMVLKEVLGIEELPAQMGWGVADQKQWQQVTLRTKEYLRAFLGLASERHVVILAQEREFASEAGSELVLPHISSALSPSNMAWLNAACDIVCQTYKRQEVKTKLTKVKEKTIKTSVPTGKIEYCLRTGPHEVYFTKFRLPKTVELPECIVDPNYEKLVEAIRGE